MVRETRERSFDELTRALASGSISRRKALRLMGAALVGGTLASVGIGGVAGADPPGCKRNGKRCTKNRSCCSENCEGGTCAAACGANGATCNSGSDCCSGLVCKGPTGQGTCVESCIPPNAIRCDPFNPTAACGPGGPGGCSCSLEGPSRQNYCVLNATVSQECTSSCDCPTGQLCHAPDGTFFCIPVCSPS